jgi:hypothetical protein
MAARRKIDYPAKLDEIAEEFGVSTSELLEEIANGELILVRRSAEDFDLDTQEGLEAAFRESWRQAMNGETRPVAELWDALEDE